MPKTVPAKGPSRKVVRARLHDHFKIAKTNLQEELLLNDSKISLALDIWTGGSNYAFMGIVLSHFSNDHIAVTCHWVDKDFQLREALLGFQQVLGSHEGSNLGQILYDIINEYGIAEKIFCATTDNASNNGTTLETFSVLLHRNNGVEWEYETHHIGCISHVLNLSLQDFMKYLKATPLAATDVDEFADGVIDEPDDELPPLPKEIDGDFFIDLIRNLRSIAKVTLL